MAAASAAAVVVTLLNAPDSAAARGSFCVHALVRHELTAVEQFYDRLADFVQMHAQVALSAAALSAGQTIEFLRARLRTEGTSFDFCDGALTFRDGVLACKSNVLLAHDASLAWMVMACLLNGCCEDDTRLDQLFHKPPNLNVALCAGSDNALFLRLFQFANDAARTSEAAFSPVSFQLPHDEAEAYYGTPLSLSPLHGAAVSPDYSLPELDLEDDFAFALGDLTPGNDVSAAVSDALVAAVDRSGVSAMHIECLIAFLVSATFCFMRRPDAAAETVPSGTTNAECLRRLALQQLRAVCTDAPGLRDQDIINLLVFVEALGARQ